MSVLRFVFTAEVLRGPFVRSGEFDDGKPWSVREVEVFEALGRNKATVRVEDDLVAAKVADVVGQTARLTVDAATKGRAKVVLVAVESLTAGNGQASAPVAAPVK